jgi:N-methylhydantoinase A
VPPSPSTFSAWGMLATDLRHDLVRTVLVALAQTDAGWAEARYDEMRREIATILPGAGAPALHRAVDLRYLGQEHTVTIALDTLGDWKHLRAQFDAAHERAYGYAARDVDVQLLNLRLAVVFPLEPPRLATLERRNSGRAAFETRKIYSMLAGDDLEYRVYQRDALRAGDQFPGPAAFEEPGTTTIIDTADTLSIENHGCLVIHVNAAGAMGGIGGSEHRSPR